MRLHLENAEEGADALDLACQTADALCQLQNPSVELLGIPPIACCTACCMLQSQRWGYFARQLPSPLLACRWAYALGMTSDDASVLCPSSLNPVSASIQVLLRALGMPFAPTISP